MEKIDHEGKIFIPLDFNCLVKIDQHKLKLSRYYIDYAFSSENLKPSNGMKVVFYDKYWTENPNEIICIGGVLEKNINEEESWSAVLNGKIYTDNQIPSRKYFSSFIGADTFAVEDSESVEQENTRDFRNDKLANINCFTFAPGSELPDFSKIIGINVSEIDNFFKFSNIKVNLPVYRPDGQLTDDTLVVRGGGNLNEVN